MSRNAAPSVMQAASPAWPAAVVALRDACLARDAHAVAETLDRRATITVDRGPDAASGAPNAAEGNEAVAAVLVRLLPDDQALTVDLAWATGSPALVVRAAAGTSGVVVAQLRRLRIRRLWFVLDRTKLTTWDRL